MAAVERIVVLGGGISGISALRKLERSVGAAELLLVEPKEYIEVPIAVLRGLMDPDGFGNTIRKPYRDVIAVRQVQAAAKSVEGDLIVLDDGSTVPFRVAIVANGSVTKGHPFIKGGGARSLADRRREFAAEAQRIRAAGSVLLIGGGPIGVELAGEIRSAYPGKRVTLVEAGGRLLPALPPRAGAKALAVLTAMGVEVLVNRRVPPDGTGVIEGTELVIRTTGIETTAIPVDGARSRNDRGQLRVDAHLRVVGRSNVFAIGDANDVPEIKLAATGGMQASVAAANATAVLRGRDVPPKSYRSPGPIGLVTLGPARGIAQMPFGRVDFVIGLKQKDMFVRRFLKRS